MLDEILGLLLRGLRLFVLRIILFPIALVVCTPFIFVRAAILALLRRQRFIHAVADGYYAIDVIWWV